MSLVSPKMMRPTLSSLRVARRAGTGAVRTFTSRDLIPNEPAKPEVHTDSVPGPASKAAVSCRIYVLN